MGEWKIETDAASAYCIEPIEKTAEWSDQVQALWFDERRKAKFESI